MKILHFSALDGRTGAGIAAARIHRGLLARGIGSRFCVAYPGADLAEAFAPPVTLAGRAIRAIRRSVSDRLLEPYARDYDYVLSTGMTGFDIRPIVQSERPDLVHLHWIGGNSFRLASLAGIAQPVVWRLSDMWPFCALHHLEPDAGKYTEPPKRQLGPWPHLPARVWRTKQATYKALTSLTLTAPSHWLWAEAKRSALLGDRPVELIPTSCDTATFCVKDRRACRTALGLPPDDAIVLIGATSLKTRMKGADLFIEAMKVTTYGEPNARPGAASIVVTFGSAPFAADVLPAGIGVKHFGQIRDERLMAMLYNAADVFVAPSRMENLANTVLEALSCGTPVVAFDIGGMPDMIEHESNGCLAPPFDTGKLADGIRWALGRRDDDGVRQAARHKIIAEFSIDQEIDKYVALYERLLAMGPMPSVHAG